MPAFPRCRRLTEIRDGIDSTVRPEELFSDSSVFLSGEHVLLPRARAILGEPGTVLIIISYTKDHYLCSIDNSFAVVKTAWPKIQVGDVYITSTGPGITGSG